MMNWDEEWREYLEDTGASRQCQAATNAGTRCKNRVIGRYCGKIHANKTNESKLAPGSLHYPGADFDNYSKGFKYGPKMSKADFFAMMDARHERLMMGSSSGGSSPKKTSPKKSPGAARFIPYAKKKASPKKKSPPKKKTPSPIRYGSF